MTKTAILLDFDGAINVIHAHKYAPGKYQFTELTFTHEGADHIVPISYHPEVVAFFNQLNNRNDVDVYWLTTWVHQTKKFSSLGFNHFASIVPTENHKDTNIRHGVLWKSDAACEFLDNNPYEQVIWVDDDLHLRYYLPYHYDTHNALWVKPNQFVGVNRRNMEDIMKFINGNHYNQMTEQQREAFFNDVK